jgi:hypothetical protein
MKSDKMMPPNLKILMDELRAEIFATLNCMQLAKIEKVTIGEQTIEASIQIKRMATDGTSTSYPVLVDVPYMVLQGGGAYIDMPIKAGDYCLILFNDRNIDNWWSTANVADPASNRKHSMSDGLAIIGFNPKTAVLDNDGTWVRILGTSGPGSEKEAARKGDAVASSPTDDPTFWTWLAAAAVVLAGLGVAAPIPTSLTGKITGGSSEVKIG